MKMTMLVFAVLALPLHTIAQGQTIWRCGADGRSYSATPCLEGPALDPVASPSAAEEAAARRTALVDERLAERMRKQRLQNESAWQRAALAGFRTTTPGPAVKTGASKKNADRRHPEAAGTSRATGLSSRRAKG